MKISKQIREINGEKPDWIMDDTQDIGYWNGMETAAQIAEDLEKETHLNPNQQIVLEWLKDNYDEDADPLGVICGMQKFGLQESELFDAVEPLNDQQQFQVLAAFAEWGISLA